MRTLLLLAAVACSGPSDPTDTGTGPAADPVEALSAPGPYAVGYREEAVSWTAPPLQAEPRELRLAVWYPAADGASGDDVKYQGLFEAPDVLGGAEAAPGAHPLAVFSHGHQGFAENSSFLAEHLASHGWWVLAPDHTGNTTWDGDDRETAIYWQRPLDLAAVLDHAEATLPLAGPVVALGHSFGGYTVLALAGARYDVDGVVPGCLDGTDDSPFCSTMTEAQADRLREGFRDPRIDAVVAMAPGDWRLFGSGLADIDLPVLLMTGGQDPGRDGDSYWADLDGADDRRVDLPTGGHQAFTDFSDTLDGPEATLDPEEGWRAIRTFALAQAAVHAAGEPLGRPVLDGDAPVSDAAVLTVR
ncbi:MAG: alpha/beta hydrolase [Myxococcota bacterium]